MHGKWSEPSLTPGPSHGGRGEWEAVAIFILVGAALAAWDTAVKMTPSPRAAVGEGRGEGRFGPIVRVCPHPSPLPEGEGAGFPWHHV